MSDDIVWEEPPPAGSKRRATGVWAQRLEPLRRRPRAWARVYGPTSQSGANGQAHNGRSGRWAGVNPSEFEITSRTIEGKGYVYARYVGGAS